MNEEDSSHPQAPTKRTDTSASFSVVSNTVQQADGIVATRSEGSLHIGPLPSPGILREYQEISPKILDEILRAFVDQGKDRRSNEAWIYKGSIIRSILGVIFAFLLGIIALGGGIYLVLNGHEVAGTVFGGGFGLVGLVNAFLLGTHLKQQWTRETRRDERQPSNVL